MSLESFNAHTTNEQPEQDIKLSMGEEALREAMQKCEITPSPEDIAKFEEWKMEQPHTSLEQPLSVSSIEECLDFLPPTQNSTTEKINLFFKKDTLSREEMNTILLEVGKQKIGYEISIVQHSEDVFSVGIGNVLRNPSPLFEGEYVGHYHPLEFTWENANSLPEVFCKSLLPSAGDVRGYHKFPDTVRNSTCITSPFGSVHITPIEGFEVTDEALQKYKEHYFPLFLGKNNFPWKSVEDVADYFREELGLELTFSFSDVQTRDHA